MGMFLQSVLVILFAILVYTFIIPDGFEPDNVKAKRVLITGGSQNIGEELAYQFSKLGAKVVVTARRETELKKVVAKCKELGALAADYIVADMVDLKQSKVVVDQAVKILGGLDYVVLNHVIGLSNSGPWNETQFNLDFAETSAVINYVSYIHVSSHATKYLKKSNGHLIVVSSLAGHFTTPYNAIYGATKAAINNFYGTLRIEMALKKQYDYSITICLLGPISTRQNRWEKYPSRVNMKGHPMDDAAVQIIRAGATRSAYLFIPKWSQFASLARGFTTDLLDRPLLKLFYNK